jgi:ABC-2 type transport system permease protein
MNGAIAIARKELRTYFYSPIAYVLLGIFLFIMGVIFGKFVMLYLDYTRMHRMGQVPSITLDRLASYFYQNMAFMLTFLSPFLTMRLFAEERRQQTFELLFTSPVSGWQLVLGKFFAAYGLMVLMLLLSFLYAGIMVLYGNPDVRVIATTYVGLLLVMACYVALGALISATTSSQAIAAIITFIVLLFLYLLQSLAQGMTSKFAGVDIGEVLGYLSPLTHFSGFNDGLVHLKDVVYFVSFTFLMLFATLRLVESNRWR